ncbi:MAG: tRNA preQ1(34) S-adenosylmethionine ribosyltransferase-isomerase QueA, partial [Elusimicrobia bacterium]|nr:tRNA preQ1(34) S-adenosylmethionine ribosyltransferase-isomerase QueA [Elusimicrobiota bacterium]MBD3412173.1 tRNA preQ1(34) S-adenosylmethionine ribosyltransferase-isomerase QueA [Elusimicrobiota bacterium]
VRVFGKKPTGGKVEILFIQSHSRDTWEALLRPAVREGTTISLWDGMSVTVVRKTKEARFMLEVSGTGRFEELVHKHGYMPLPPYIKRPHLSAQTKSTDSNMYQTVYAKHNGSIAAPTAGLHFTTSLLDALKQKGVPVVEIMLHVGLGTFKKITAPNITEHVMEKEYFEISSSAARTINATRHQEGRIIAVGTTTVRALESSVDESGFVSSGNAWTDIFIHPGFQFRAVDSLITNFHLPRHSPFVMVSALVGLEQLKKIYREAIHEQYRFYSYGDAMLAL